MSILSFLKTKKIKTEAELRETMRETAVATYRLETVEQRLKVETAQLKQDYGGDIAALKKAIKAGESALEAWSRDNQTSARVVMDGHSLILRESPGVVELMPGVTEEAVLDAILAADDDALIGQAITIKTTINREGLHAISRQPNGEAFLASIGVVIAKPKLWAFKPASVADAEGNLPAGFD